MKSRLSMILVALIVVLMVATAFAEVSPFAVTPQQVLEALHGPATKNNTPMQNDLIRKKYYAQLVKGEGVVDSIYKHDYSKDHSDLAFILGRREQWLMSIWVKKNDSPLKVTLILGDLSSASTVKSGDSVKFQGYFWSSFDKLKPKEGGEMALIVLFVGNILK